MATSPVARRDLVALVLAATCWGVGTVISKAALDEVPPLTLLPIQLAVSLVILAVLMRRQGISFRSDGSPLLGRLGLLNPGAAYALSLLGLATITASLSVLLWALEPLMILFLAGWFLRERITPSLRRPLAGRGRRGGRDPLRPSGEHRPGHRGGPHPGGHRLLCGLLGDHATLDPRCPGDEPGDPRPAGARARPSRSCSSSWSASPVARSAVVADPAGHGQRGRVRRVVLRRRVLVLSRRAAPRARFVRRAVVLSHPDRRGDGRRAPAG